MESEQLELPIIVSPFNQLKYASLILTFLFVMLGISFIFVGTIFPVLFGISLILLTIFFTSKAIFSKIALDGSKLVIKGIFQSKEIDIHEISEIYGIKMFGTVGNVPISFSRVSFKLRNGENMTLKLRSYPYQSMYQILSYIKNLEI